MILIHGCAAVIGHGAAELVEKASELALAAGAKRCVPLHVSGPFHTSLMRPAGDALARRFQTMACSPLRFPVVHNATGLPMQAGETLAGLLEQQVQRSVHFEDSIRWLAGQGVDTIVEIGPGKTLTGFARKISKELQVIAVETPEGVQKAAQQA